MRSYYGGGGGSRLRPVAFAYNGACAKQASDGLYSRFARKHGIEEIAVTLAYLPGAVDYFEDGADFGISLQYFVEDTPLGTAGSVRNAAGFLPETFVVISGDALTDLDISKAVAFHKERGSLATLVLHRQQVPLEYGVVITDEENNPVFRETKLGGSVQRHCQHWYLHFRAGGAGVCGPGQAN